MNIFKAMERIPKLAGDKNFLSLDLGVLPREKLVVYLSNFGLISIYSRKSRRSVRQEKREEEKRRRKKEERREKREEKRREEKRREVEEEDITNKGPINVLVSIKKGCSYCISNHVFLSLPCLKKI